MASCRTQLRSLERTDRFHATTVFNYYPSDYTLAGGDIPGPEFGIFGTAEFLNRANLVTSFSTTISSRATTNRVGAQDPVLRDATGTPSPTLAPFLADASERGRAGGARGPAAASRHHDARHARKTVVNAVNKIPIHAGTLRRAKLAFNLVLVSIDYQVQK